MPREIRDFKEFTQILKTQKDTAAKDKSAPKKIVYVKQGKKITKFKLRKSKYLYTFKTDKSNVAKKILESLSGNIQKVQLKGRRSNNKKVAKK